jgi:hypothetical protein
MQHAQFISAKRLAVATISIFALIPILRTEGTARDDGRSTSIIDMPRLLMLVLLGIS